MAQRSVLVTDVAGRLCHMGEGVLPCAEITRLLEENCFEGYLSLEWEKMWIPELDGPEIAFPGYVDYMKRALCGPETP